MKCQRTGWCCIGLEVMVAVPTATGGFNLIQKSTGVRCPNLSHDEDGKASCAIHDEPWYPETPCAIYQDSTRDPDFAPKAGLPCMLGPYIAKERDLTTYGDEPPKGGLRIWEEDWKP